MLNQFLVIATASSIRALKEIGYWVDYFLFREQQEKYHNQLANAEEIKRYYKIKKKLKLGDRPLLMKIQHLLFAFGDDACILHPATSTDFSQKGEPVRRLADETPYVNFHFDTGTLTEHLINSHGATVVFS